jgi:hypothetical protein
MNLISWIKRRVFRLDDASARYQQALASANKHDLSAALAGYTAVIDMENTPPDLRAMALYNRSVVYTTTGCDAQAIADLELVLELPGAAANVKVEARRKLLRMKRSSERADDRSSQGNS